MCCLFVVNNLSPDSFRNWGGGREGDTFVFKVSLSQYVQMPTSESKDHFLGLGFFFFSHHCIKASENIFILVTETLEKCLN